MIDSRDSAEVDGSTEARPTEVSAASSDPGCDRVRRTNQPLVRVAKIASGFVTFIATVLAVVFLVWPELAPDPPNTHFAGQLSVRSLEPGVTHPADPRNGCSRS